MVNTLSHTIELISTLKILRVILWVHIIHQPTGINIKVPGVIGSNNSIGSKIVCIETLTTHDGAITSITRVPCYFPK